MAAAAVPIELAEPTSVGDGDDAARTEFGTGLRARLKVKRGWREAATVVAVASGISRFVELPPEPVSAEVFFEPPQLVAVPPVSPAEPFSPELALVSPHPIEVADAQSLAAVIGSVRAARALPLGALLREAGLLSAEEIEQALTEAERKQTRLGEVLTQGGAVSTRDLIRMLAEQRGLPFVDLQHIGVDHGAARLLPESVARPTRTLPIGFVRGLPVVAVADPTDDDAMGGVKSLLSAVHFVASVEDELLAELARAYS
jgi:Type II secretion system (T2SS), protein E, N-terminal domain